MKKKNRTQRNRRRSGRHEVRAVHTKSCGRAPKKKIECASTPWLRIVPSGTEDDPISNASRGFFPLRSGKRQPRDLDLYMPEDDLRNR